MQNWQKAVEKAKKCPQNVNIENAAKNKRACTIEKFSSSFLVFNKLGIILAHSNQYA